MPRLTTTELRDQVFRNLQERLSGLRLRVWENLTIWGPTTTRILAQRSGIDILTVRPRVTELVECGLAELTEMRDGEGVYVAVRMTIAVERKAKAAEDAGRPKQLGLL